MILKFIIEIVTFIGVAFAKILLGILDIPDFSETLSSATGGIIEFCTQAVNFMYFLIGDLFTFIAPFAIMLVPIKLLIAPIIAFMRGFIRWGS